jgi:hypothetical protein
MGRLQLTEEGIVTHTLISHVDAPPFVLLLDAEPMPTTTSIAHAPAATFEVERPAPELEAERRLAEATGRGSTGAFT